MPIPGQCMTIFNIIVLTGAGHITSYQKQVKDRNVAKMMKRKNSPQKKTQGRNDSQRIAQNRYKQYI